ncbi:Ppx/GppA family phosphatase [Weissella diestrammenae]|uniref:Ppx/GppA family phosphatase n=1 Tax=Weissella diestrammenae TaxID=1162633 RepID=A0A7G9T3M5_9LACO|nr:Ppx/GppA family phosphatase [Weissella diestrammenae]MCM0582677.1 Ppx/GppA family phosphatase [Weissella diestrammenae]QNN74700.1 Ppx/GppA family phosphatase [Weissella diestrammenae]
MAVITVIDLGSNSTRMTISRVHHDGSYEALYRDQSMVRLSEGMGIDKTLQKPAMARTIKIMQTFMAAAKKYQTDQLIAVATAAVRQAQNADAFSKLLKKETGITLRILSGDEEAYYDYLAVINTLPTEDFVIMDTGGGSVELVQVQGRKAMQMLSVPIGAVNLSETFFKGQTVSATELFRATISVEKRFDNIAWLQNVKNLPIVALGGSNRTFAKIARRQRQETDLPVHGYRLSAEDCYTIFADVISKNVSSRGKIPGLAKERADIIVGGMLPLITGLRTIDAPHVVFSQASLREGIVFEYIMQKTGQKIIAPMPGAMTQDDDEN